MSAEGSAKGSFRALRIQLFTATWLSYAGFYFTRKVFSVVKGPVKEALHVDDLLVSHLFTAYLVTYMLGMFATAWLSKRMRSRTQLLWGMGISVVCNLVIGALLPMGQGAYVPILLMMAVHGAAQAMGWPNNVALMANWTKKAERGTVMAAWGTCYQLGSVGAKGFAAFVFGWLGLVWSFWAASLVLIAIWVMFYVWGRESPERCGHPALESETPAEVPENDAKGATAQPTITPEEQEKRVFRLVVAMGLIYFSFKFLRYALDSWTVLIIVERFHMKTDAAGYLSTAFDWVGFVGVIVAGTLSDKVFKGSRAPIIFLMTAGCFIATILLFWIGLRSPAYFGVLLGLIGFMAMGPDSLLSGAGAMDVGSRKQAAAAAGIINGLGSIGPIVQEPAIGWLKTYFGLNAVFLLLVVMTGIATAGTALLLQNVRKFKLPL